MGKKISPIQGKKSLASRQRVTVGKDEEEKRIGCTRGRKRAEKKKRSN